MQLTNKKKKIMETKKAKFYVWATDKCLSGWGRATNRIHKHIVLCDSEEERDRILCGFEGSWEFKHVNWSCDRPRWATPSSEKYSFTEWESGEWARFK